MGWGLRIVIGMVGEDQAMDGVEFIGVSSREESSVE